MFGNLPSALATGPVEQSEDVLFELIGASAHRGNLYLFRKPEVSSGGKSSPLAAIFTSDRSRRSGEIIAEALRHPVTITQRNKPRLVLLNIDDYERLMRAIRCSDSWQA